MTRFITHCCAVLCVLTLLGVSLPQTATVAVAQGNAIADTMSHGSACCCPENATEKMACCDTDNGPQFPCGSDDCQCKFTPGLTLFVMDVAAAPMLSTSVEVAYLGFTPMPYDTLLPPPRKPPKIA